MVRIVLLCLLCLVATTGSLPQRAAPEVILSFSKDTILLGEPVWVHVTARNTSPVPIRWNPRYYCGPDIPRPVTAAIADAAAGAGRPTQCVYAVFGGNCSLGGNRTVIAAGASATWRFLLEGDFHFTRPGTYSVIVTAHPARFVPTSARDPFENGSLDSTTRNLQLVVLPRNDVALLAREKGIAAELEAAIANERIASRAVGGDSAERTSLNLREIRRGLAAQPVAGMEEVFSRWLSFSNDYERDAIDGLRNLNTAASRAALATLAGKPSAPNWSTQDLAISALGEIGNAEFLPLLIAQIPTTDERVHRSAIFAAGKVGEAAVPKLGELLRGTSADDRRDAATALGTSNSRAAVKTLIDALAASNAEVSNIEWALFLLTHHELPRVNTLRTPDQLHSEWMRWWDGGGKDARVYSRFECARR